MPTIAFPSLGVNLDARRHFEFSLYSTPAKEVPTLGGVYAIWEHNRLAYIGKTSNIRTRLHAHKDGKDGYFAWETCVTFLPIPDEAHRVITEKWLIRRYTPRYNKHLYGGTHCFDREKPRINSGSHWNYDSLRQIVYNNRDGCKCGCGGTIEIPIDQLNRESCSKIFGHLWDFHESDAMDLPSDLSRFGGAK